MNFECAAHCGGVTLGRSICLCSDQAGPQSASSQSWSCAQHGCRGGMGLECDTPPARPGAGAGANAVCHYA